MSDTDAISFLPEDYLDKKTQRRTNVICAVLAGIVMAAIGSAFSLTEKVSQAAELHHAQVEREYAGAAKQIQQFQELEKKERVMAHQAELAASLLEKVPRSIVLAEVTNAVPLGISLGEFSLDSTRVMSHTPPPDPAKAAAAPADPIVYDVKLKVSGIAANDMQVASFIHRLSISPLFTDVNLVVSDELSANADKNGGPKLRKFEIEMGMNPDADATALNGRTSNNTTVGAAGNSTTAALPAN